MSAGCLLDVLLDVCGESDSSFGALRIEGSFYRASSLTLL
jgi:hypothetical protein